MNNVLAECNLTKHRLLVVDQEHELLSPLTVQLEHAGFSVWKARRGEEALAIVREVRPALVVINPTLNDMNGFKLAVQLKEESNIPFLFLTDQLSDEFREAALTVGALQYLSKGSRPDENVTHIRLALQTLTNHTASLEKKLDSTKKRQSMISVYMELWQVDEKYVKDAITMFARKRSVSIDKLAEVHQEYRVAMRSLRATQISEMKKLEETHGKQVKAIEPELIGELTDFFEESCKRRLAVNSRQLDLGMTGEIRSAKI